MEEQMTLYFIRHADKAKGDYGSSNLPHLDQPISKYGKKQAKALYNYFHNKQIDEIFLSEYRRTEQTIRAIIKRRKIRPTIDARLNEINLGDLIGLTDEQFQIKFPDIWKAYQDRNVDFRWPGGETGAEAQSRIVSFLAEQSNHPGNKLIVAHDGIIRLLLCHLLNIPVYRRFDFQIGTAGIMEIEWDKDQQAWRIIRFNQELI
jgi:broad specificity phosphatase PhoE